MLHRVRTKKNQRRPLGRSKSTDSIVRTSIYALHRDPVVAERDAHIAARLSYQRVHSRKREGMEALTQEQHPLSFGGEARGVSRHGFARCDSERCQLREASNAGIARHQSIRFTGPNARSRRALGSRSSENRTTVVSTDDGISSFAGPERRLRGALSETRGGSTASSLNHPCAAQTPEAPYLLEDKISSMPSSYRTVRKSRSMFTPADQSQAGCSFTNSPAQGKTNPRSSRYMSLNDENTLAATCEVTNLRAPKSMSFLRSRREQTPQTSSRAHHELAMQLAREKFREQTESPLRLKSQSSLFFRSKARLTDSSTGLRKSLRNSSNNSAPLSSAFSGDSLSIPKQGSFRKKARKVSRTIKTKLKEIFSRQQTEEAGNYCHHPEANDFEADSHLSLEPHPHTEEASMSRGPSRIASLHAVPSCQQMKSRQGSLEGCDAENGSPQDDKSRVTSWTDSVANTAISPLNTGDRNHQHLSVVRENGMHVSSSAPLQPMVSQDFVIGKAITVDSQRIYSALMKRANDMNGREEDSRRQNVDEMRSSGRPPPRGSSVDRLRPNEWSPPTIRCVRPEDDVFQDEINNDLQKVSHSPGNIETRTSVSSLRNSPHPPPNPWLSTNVDEARPLGNAGLASYTSADRPKAMTQRSSAFFASPSSHLFRTQSPFRRVLQENMKASDETGQGNEGHVCGAEYLGSLSAISLPTRQPSTTGSGGEAPGIYADSMYSRTEEDVRPEASLVEKFPEPPPARIQTDASTFVGISGEPHSTSRREISDASSVEWKTWLSSHVSKLEEAGIDPNDQPAFVPSPRSTRKGHLRENAEIEPPEIEPPTDQVPSPPENPRTVNDATPLKPVLGTSLPSPSMNVIWRSRRVTPGVENEAPLRHDDFEADKLPAPTPPNKIFQATPSLPTLNTKQSGSSPKAGKATLRQSASFNAMSNSDSTARETLPSQWRARRRLAGPVGSSAKSSPGLTAAVERQFGKANAGSPGQPLRRGASTLESADNMTPGAGLSEIEKVEGVFHGDVQGLTSRKMVESFLNSRRRKVDGSTTGSSEGSSPAAFL